MSRRGPISPSLIWLIVVTSSLVSTAKPSFGQSAESLLERGLYTENALGDPRAALEHYRRALRRRPLAPATEARLRLRRAICHDALGDESKARAEFEIVATRFDEIDEVAQAARRYLGSVVREDPARFMPQDVLFYVELVNPGAELENLAAALRDTPFENPVDVLRARGANEREKNGRLPRGAETGDEAENEVGEEERGAAPGDESSAGDKKPTTVDFIAATFNRAIFRELSKIGGVAIGIPRPGELIGVTSLGGSDVLAGIVTSFLSIERPPRVGFARGLPIYEFDDEDDDDDDDDDDPVHLAFGGDLLVWGRPRERVEAAVERYFSRSPSLATSPDFRVAATRRPDALLFAYLGPSWLSTWRKNLSSRSEGFDEAVLVGLDRVLGLQESRPVSARIESTALTDSLHVTAHFGAPTKARSEIWPALATPRLEPEILRCVPEDSIGFLALRFDEGKARWATIRRGLEELSEAMGEQLEKAGKDAASRTSEFDESIDRLRSRLEIPPGSEFLADLRSVVIGAVESPIFAVYQNIFLIFEFEDADRGEKILRESLERLARRLTKRPEGREFQAIDLEVDDHPFTIHRLEALPALRPTYARVGDRFVVTLAESTIRSSVRAFHRTGVEIQRSVPSGANKVLYVKPRSIVRMTSIGRSADPDPTRLFFSHVERLLVYTREHAEGLSLDLEVPKLTPTLRAVLNEAAKIIEAAAQRDESEEESDD